jgi:ubiquinone biosynthesis protein
MNFSRSTRRVRGVRRFATIARVLVKHGFGDLLDRSLLRGKVFPAGSRRSAAVRTAYPSPRRIRRALEELGPSFIKLGQLMSTRSDLFPADTIEELKKLQDSVPPIPAKEIQAVIEKELKRPLPDLFSAFETEALAAASVAQVHLAHLTTGEKVAVKVIRPGIAKMIREDVQLMYALSQRIEQSFEIGRVIGAVNLVREFERNIFRELDMLTEAGNIERFAANFKASDELYIPRVYWEYTSHSVLVMEHIEGVRMDRVAEMRALGIDPQEIAMIGLRAFSRQLMEFGLFHADPHPGNTIVMSDGRVSLLDFGIIGYLDEETMLQIANVFLGYAEHDYDMVMDALQQAELIDADMMDVNAFRTDLKDVSEPFYGRSLQTIAVKDVYDQVMQLVLKYRIRLPRNLLLLLKTFIQTEALGKILGSDASLLEVTRPYAKALLQRGYDAQKLIRNLGKEARSAGGYMRMVPKFLHDILRAAAGGKHRIEVWHSGFQQIDSKLEKGINRLTVGIVISASLIAGSLVLNASQRVFELPLNLFGIQTISITALLGLVGYTMATVLGLWLIFSIFRSGRM